MCRKLIFFALLMVGFLISVVFTSVMASQENVVAVRANSTVMVEKNDAVANGLATTDVDIGHAKNVVSLDGSVAQTISLEVTAKDCDIGAVQNSNKAEIIEVTAVYFSEPEEPKAMVWQNVEKMATVHGETCMAEIIVAEKVKKKRTGVEMAKVIHGKVSTAGTIHWATVANGQRAPSTSNNTRAKKNACNALALRLCA